MDVVIKFVVSVCKPVEVFLVDSDGVMISGYIFAVLMAVVELPNILGRCRKYVFVGFDFLSISR